MSWASDSKVQETQTRPPQRQSNLMLGPQLLGHPGPDYSLIDFTGMLGMLRNDVCVSIDLTGMLGMPRNDVCVSSSGKASRIAYVLEDGPETFKLKVSYNKWLTKRLLHPHINVFLHECDTGKDAAPDACAQQRRG